AVVLAHNIHPAHESLLVDGADDGLTCPVDDFRIDRTASQRRLENLMQRFNARADSREALRLETVGYGYERVAFVEFRAQAHRRIRARDQAGCAGRMRLHRLRMRVAAHAEDDARITRTPL